MGAAIKIWGHRGCKGERSAPKISNPPENSLASFREAIKQRADGFELDVFLTADKKLVVFHDDTLERMSNGQGNVTDHTFDELRHLRLKDGKGQLTELQIPTLDEVLDVANEARRNNPAFTVNIEIKGLGIASHVADTIQKRLDDGWKLGNFQVSSFDMASLREMRQAHPHISIGALFKDMPSKFPHDINEAQLEKRLVETADIHPDTINISLPSMTPNAVRMIQAAGAKPVAWTAGEINPEILMQEADGGRAAALRILNSGLDAMITDYPEEMRLLLDKFQAKQNARVM